MVTITLSCPHCGSEAQGQTFTQAGKQAGSSRQAGTPLVERFRLCVVSTVRQILSHHEAHPSVPSRRGT
jgi:hypothetical protein